MHLYCVGVIAFYCKTTGVIRSSVNRSTGLSSNQMMLGRKVNSPVDLVFPPVQEDKVNTATD